MYPFASVSFSNQNWTNEMWSIIVHYKHPSLRLGPRSAMSGGACALVLFHVRGTTRARSATHSLSGSFGWMIGSLARWLACWAWSLRRLAKVNQAAFVLHFPGCWLILCRDFLRLMWCELLMRAKECNYFWFATAKQVCFAMWMASFWSFFPLLVQNIQPLPWASRTRESN